MMGVGKSTLGKIVAKKEGFKFIDTDLNIEKKFSMTIPEIFKEKGEGFFRMEEEKIVLECLEINKSVIAIGGGAFLNKKVREKILKNSISIWLDLNLKAINKRVEWNNKRPLLTKKNSQNKINKLYSERKNIYSQAEHKINCDKLTKAEIVKTIIKLNEK